MLKASKKMLLLLICIYLLQIHAQGQNGSDTITISGKVEVITDSSGLFYSPPNLVQDDPYALPGASVVVMDLDSTVVTYAVTDQANGTFKLTGLTVDEYILKTIYVGYEDSYNRLTIDTNDSLFLELKLGHIYIPSSLPFHEATAADDLNNGIVQFKIWGELIGGTHRLEDPELQEDFNFEVVRVYEDYADVYKQQWEKLRQATIRYNLTVDNYLSKRYTEEWESLRGIW